MMLQSPGLKYVADPYAYARRRTREVMVGNVGVGAYNPIRVQSMTTTRTQDVTGTAAQAIALIEAGCEIVRITAPTVQDARAIGESRKIIRAAGFDTPLVADIHFSPEAAMEAANHVEKVRINPGTMLTRASLPCSSTPTGSMRRSWSGYGIGSHRSSAAARSSESPCALARITDRCLTGS